MAQSIVIVNTGCANISSLKFAVERLDYSVLVTDDLNQIASADKVLLPGVGSAKAAMQQIEEKGLTECLQNLEQPTLGICLGMQLLTRRSEEGNCDCLNLVDTQVTEMHSDDLPLPHMGWNQTNYNHEHPLFVGIPQGSYFYFVHGFCVEVGSHTIATSNYAGQFSAAIQQNNFYGVQFHPERSSQAGAQLLKNFIEKI